MEMILRVWNGPWVCLSRRAFRRAHMILAGSTAGFVLLLGTATINPEG